MTATSTNKVAFITGSSSGIGLVTAKALAASHFDVIIHGLEKRQDDVITTILSELRSYGVSADFVEGDLRQLADIDKMCAHISQIHPAGVDILINNAGINHVCEIDTFPDAMFADMTSVMLAAPFYITKRLLPPMRNKGWGRIVNISSQLGIVSAPGKTAYTTLKSGLIGFTKGVALETAECGITCNAICPTFVLTELFEKQVRNIARDQGLTFEVALKIFTDKVPTGKCATVEQVSSLIMFLITSEASSQITGAAYTLDGGYTAQ